MQLSMIIFQRISRKRSFVSTQQNHRKSLQQLNQVIIKIEGNMILIRDPKTFYFDFDWAKDVDENLKDEIEFIIKSN